MEGTKLIVFIHSNDVYESTKFWALRAKLRALSVYLLSEAVLTKMHQVDLVEECYHCVTLDDNFWLSQKDSIEILLNKYT